MRNKKYPIEPEIGKKIGKLTITDFCRFNNKKGVICLCDCGNKIEANFFSVKYQLKTSCGCAYRINVLGQRFGKLLVIEEMPPNAKGNRMVKCVCDCGNTKIVAGNAIKRGQYKSCGCNRTPQTTKMYRDHPLYDVWKGMKARCYDKNHIGYKIYGGRGVVVCKEWREYFVLFYNWCLANGWKQGLQLDKDIIPKKLGLPALLYSPEMCCFVTSKVNGRNSRQAKLNTELVKEILSSEDNYKNIAEKYNVHKSTIQNIKSGKTWG